MNEMNMFEWFGRMVCSKQHTISIPYCLRIWSSEFIYEMCSNSAQASTERIDTPTHTVYHRVETHLKSVQSPIQITIIQI